ncbi:FtsQ-type POTRA domain-containing protein [Propionibacterium freudenreichii]|uniref:FtsQ-type POTRA domain-containing protein n=1 Tax=Propionibacterium freudenreichii TaxID=1744 RepID=UPI00254C8355|nr:FtsQ-type POTRA domain-containing protein [Propionibacterium freudenreichii]MDK9593578.1 FtsQ-type POTRA domain-containing protein [Propionibacterium freudenreichii]
MTQVRQAAGIAKGSSLAGLNAHAIEQRVAKLPVMASCHLTRSWPSAVTLQVHRTQARLPGAGRRQLPVDR